mmetsp:Transcript_38209/g.111892  ORF Transcript_38209/g.111892 Transcript_38209/m.111892 type:complete len:129 (+) Transcript_38209:370-756(+)
MWSPKVLARKLDPSKLVIPEFNANTRQRSRLAADDPLSKRANAMAPSPLVGSTNGKAHDDSAVQAAKEADVIPQTPTFKRRGLNKEGKEGRTQRLKHLSSVAQGKYPSGPSAASRMLVGRAVYHSTTW